MKNLNFLSNLCGLGRASQSSDVGYDCRSTVARPSFDCRSSLLKLVSVLVLVLTIGSGNVWADAVFTPSSRNAGSLTGAPTGATATYYNSYNNANQITGGNTATLTLSGFDGCTITGVTLRLRKSSGTKSAGITGDANGSQFINQTVSSSSLSTSYNNFAMTLSTTPLIGTGKTIQIVITPSTSSIYVESFTIAFTAATPKTVLFNTGAGNPSVSSRTEASGGAGITLPSSSDLTPACSGDGWVLYGWATAAYGSSSTTTAPSATLAGLAGATYKPATNNVTLYAVYKKTTGDPVARTLSATYASHTGWTESDNMCNNGYWVLCTGGTLTSPELVDISTVTSITFNARTYGGASYNTVTVKTSGGTTVGSASAANTTMTSKTISVSGLSGSGSFIFSGSATTASYGPGMNNVVINYSETPALYWSAPTCCSDPGLAYGTGSVVKTYGDAAFTNTLTNSHNVTVTYAASSVSPAGCVSVNSSSGKVTISGAGSATITASSTQQTISTVTYCADEASYTLTVNKADISPTLSYDATTIAVGSTSSSPSISGNSGSGTVTYSSSNTSVATVNESTGVVTAVSAGSATITATIGATANYNGSTATASFTITAGSTWKFKYSGDSWTEHTMTESAGTASYSISLAADSRFEFGIDDNGTFYKNNGTIITTTSGWVFNTSDNNCHIHTGPAGTYTFAINTTTKAVTVTYPSVSHPNEHYVYFKNTNVWGTVYGYLANSGNDNKAAAWPGSVMQATTTICGETYHYAALNAMSGTYNTIIFNNGSGGYGNQTSDLSTTGSLGKFNANQDANWHDFKYSITFAGNGNTGGSMSDVSNICIGSNQTIASNGYTKTDHTFIGWKANVDVKIGGETVTAGTLIAGGSTIQDIQSNIVLTAQWRHVPVITVSETSRAFGDRKVNGGPYTMTFNVSGSYLKGNISLAVSGTNAAMFDVTPKTLTPTTGTVTSTEITVSYSPTGAGSHSAQVDITSTDATSKTVTLTGTGKWEVTWNNNGSTSTTLVANSTKPTFPSTPVSCDGTSTTFIGWATAPWTGKIASLADKTVHTSNSTMSAVTANGTTYYAVFASGSLYYGRLTSSELSSLAAGSKLVIVAVDQGYVLKNDLTCSSSVPTETAGAITPDDDLIWELAGSSGSWNIKSSSNNLGTLYDNCAGSGNGLALNFNTYHQSYTIASSSHETNEFYIKDNSCDNGVLTKASKYDDFRIVTISSYSSAASAALKLYTQKGSYSDYLTTCCEQYDITLASSGSVTGGTFTASPTSACEDAEVTLSATPADGYSFAGWTVTKAASPYTDITSTNVDGNTLTMPAYGVTVNASFAPLTGITVKTAPTKTTYCEGDNFDPTGLVITASFSNSTTLDIPYSGNEAKFTFSPTTAAALTTGNTSVTITYSGQSTSQAITVNGKLAVTKTGSGTVTGGTFTVDNATACVSTTINIEAAAASHYTFGSWTITKTSDGTDVTASVSIGSASSATTSFTMPAYGVTVTPTFNEDAYHTATFKNNGAVIAGYDAVKTYDGERPSAPTLTDITDACDKTDCNKFYGWIAEDGIWNQTINSVVGKTIYRSASSIPVVSGADVVYHAVWAKGEAAPALIAPTPIIYWARQSIAVSTNISATSGTGTLNSNVAFTSDTYAKVYNSASLSSYPTITLSNLNMSSATGSTVSISFFTRGTNASKGDMTVKYTDQGEESTAGVVTVLNGIIAYHEVSGIPKTATQIKLVHSANSGNLAIGTIKIFEPNTTSYTFTELTSENTSGWANADWDGNYLITNGSTNALDGNGIGERSFATVSASDGTITTTNSGAAFVVTWVSGSGFKVQGVGCGDYLNTASNSVAPSESIVYLSGIAYNGITDGSSNTLKYNSTKFGFYASAGTDIKLYKILPSFSEFRITCCDNTVTIGTPAKTGSGTVTFASGGDAYVAGDEVETCYGATTITATVTPTNGYQCTVLSFTRSDEAALTPDPAISVPFTGAQNYDLTFEQNADGVTLNTTVTFVALIDHYIDNMHYNTTQNKSGNYGTAPTLSDETKGEQCTGLHYKFIGWVPEGDMNMTTGVPTTTANMVAGGASGKYATGTNYYAVWAEEE